MACELSFSRDVKRDGNQVISLPHSPSAFLGLVYVIHGYSPSYSAQSLNVAPFVKIF